MADSPDDISLSFSITVQLPRRTGTGTIEERDTPHLPPRRPASPSSHAPHSARFAVVAAAAAPALSADAVVTVIAEGVATTVAVLALPEVLLGLGAAAAVAIIAAGVRYVFGNPGAASAWARRVVQLVQPVEGMTMVDPLPPLPPMESPALDLPAHTGHDQPVVRLPALRLPNPPSLVPPVLAGSPITVPIPTVVESRTKGSSSRGARKAARKADLEVTQILDEADWRAHHLVNLATLRQAKKVLLWAKKAGWRPDLPSNIAALPHTPDAQTTLRGKRIRKPVHNSGHPNWNRSVENDLEKIEEELDRRYGTGERDEKNQAAFREMMRLQRKLRRRMLRYDRLTMQDGQSPNERDA